MANKSRPQKDRYERFARNYVKTLNIKKAYELSGFEKKGDSHPYDTFKRKDVQELVAKYTEQYNQRLDISVEKILKHFAAIAFHNPLDLIDFDEKVDPKTGEIYCTGTRLKSPSQIPPWMGVAISSIKEQPSPDGGISMEYKFESKTTALTRLLEHLQKTKTTNKETTIVIKHQSTDEDDGPEINISL